MYYLFAWRVLYVRKEVAICALEAGVLRSQPGKQAHLHLQRRQRSQRCDFLDRLCLQCPSMSLVNLLGGPLGSAHPSILSRVVCM